MRPNDARCLILPPIETTTNLTVIGRRLPPPSPTQIPTYHRIDKYETIDDEVNRSAVIDNDDLSEWPAGTAFLSS